MSGEIDILIYSILPILAFVKDRPFCVRFFEPFRFYFQSNESKTKVDESTIALYDIWYCCEKMHVKVAE